MATAGRIQLQLPMPYKLEPADHPTVRDYLSRGWRIVSFERTHDREALVTLEPASQPAAGA
jgi:hypothetical protein